ncbi:hypothetical protein ACFOG5_02655 [Pedobacter fastidiosus]|uniref:hypothetical protein n=1 Tax=Pedobacter fastidiosus TaxID=2765361 RepID=UPI00361C0998
MAWVLLPVSFIPELTYEPYKNLLHNIGHNIFPGRQYTQTGCLIADGSGGERLFFVAHPDGNPAHYTSTGTNTNYIVLNTGPYNCTNYSTSTFATNLGSVGMACTVLQNTGQVTYNNGVVINGYTVYHCGLDNYLWLLGALLGWMSFTFIREHFRST